MRMARAPLARDTGKLRFGNADRLVRSTDRFFAIPLPSFEFASGEAYPGGPNPRE